MPRFTIGTVLDKTSKNPSDSGYDRAMTLVRALREKGINANEVVGGIGIYPENAEQESLMRQICQEFGAPLLETGETRMESDVTNFGQNPKIR
jgi:hypothetical protein